MEIRIAARLPCRPAIHAAHPMPAAAVTAAAVVFGVAAGNSAGTCVLLGCAVLAGQLSVGWSNDRMDVTRDRVVGHKGKPLAAGKVSLRVVDVAIVVTIAATILLSFALGWRAGTVHVAAVAVAWLYNGWLKRTPLSWLPYTLAFGALPAVATLALGSHPAPAAWVVATTALIGTAVNFVNALPALAARPGSDVRGLPDRLGGRPSLLVASVLLAAAGTIVAIGPARAPSAISWIELALTFIASTVGTAALWRRADSRNPFFGLMAIAAVQLLAAVITGHPLH